MVRATRSRLASHWARAVQEPKPYKAVQGEGLAGSNDDCNVGVPRDKEEVVFFGEKRAGFSDFCFSENKAYAVITWTWGAEGWEEERG